MIQKLKISDPKRAIVITVALFIILGIAGYAVFAAGGIGYTSPFADAIEYGSIAPARITFPDSTSDSNREFIPQINWVIPGQYSNNGKNAAPISVCSMKLQNYFNAYAVQKYRDQYVLYNSGNQLWMGWMKTGSGQYALWPSNLNKTSTEDRNYAYTNYLGEDSISQMKSSVGSWYNSGIYQVNLLYKEGYRNNGAGSPWASGYALDGYFLPPDLKVRDLWTLPPVGQTGKVAAIFENKFPARINVNMYLYAVVNGIPREIESRPNQPMQPFGIWQLDGDYPAGTTKIVATIGAPWNGVSWPQSVDVNTTSLTCSDLNLTLTGKKIELGSDLYLSETKSMLASHWNDNYKELLDPEQPGAPPEQPSDIAALMLTPIDPVTQQIQAYVTPSTKFKMKFNYISGFNESGNTMVRLYREDKDTYVKTLVSEKLVYVKKGQADVIFDPELQHSEGVYRYIATINYRWGSGWVGEKFAGRDESTYDNNKVETDVRSTVGGPPTGVGYWPPVVTKKTPIIEKVPVWGWKKVEYDVEELKIKTRLVE